MPDPEMMKTSVFALAQQGSGGGAGRVSCSWPRSPAPSAGADVETGESRAQCRLPRAPLRGRSTSEGLRPGDRPPGRQALVLPWRLCKFALSRGVHNKDLWGLLWGKLGGETSNK